MPETEKPDREVQQEERGDQGLPGQGGHNREDTHPKQPDRDTDAADRPKDESEN